MFNAILRSAAVMLCLVVVAGTADANPSGQWSWIIKGRKGAPNKKIAGSFKVSGDKLTGTVSAPKKDGTLVPTAILDGKVNGDQFTFRTVRVNDGVESETKYEGTVTGSEISGSMYFKLHGQPVSMMWTAKRK